MIIAIDGPAGSGKGTITELLAERYDLLKIDTGAMYRAIALKALNKGLTEDDEEEIIEFLSETTIELQKDKIFLDGKNVSKEIRSKEVNEIVSQISSIIPVRLKLVEMQRDMAKDEKDIIMEGRDIGTVVFPNADIKIFLDASLEERAKRRVLQNKEKGIESSYEEILESIRKRDENDKNKTMGAMKKALDAISIDTTGISIENVVSIIGKIIEEKYVWKRL